MIPCTIWTGTKHHMGYGVKKHQGKMWQAHRYVWTLANGPIPEGMCVCHRCNNKLCVELSHLYLATRKQNSTDAATDGLYRTGESHPKTTLTEEDVREIKRLPKRKSREIGAIYGVSHRTILNIWNGKTWGHVT